MMVKELKDPAMNTTDKRTRVLFLILIVLFTFLLYGNTIKNNYSYDDYIIKELDPGFSDNKAGAFGEIFNATNTTDTPDDLATYNGFRPVTKFVYALEYSIFGVNPSAAHVFSILLYLAVVLVLFRVLQRIFRGYSAWFPFIIILLFIAHPVHTEVVAGLHNRDELLSMLFALLTLQLLMKYHDRSSPGYLIGALALYALAFLSKPTAIAFWIVYPLTLYFFTGMKMKRILMVFALLTLTIFLSGIVPLWFIDGSTNANMVSNPLYFEDNVWYVIGTGMYSLGYYLKLLVYPNPLLYYYGYNMIPVVNLANPWVIMSIVFHLAILGIAIWKLREKHVISYAIFFYLVSMAMFANILLPVPGIIGERFLLVPSVAFAIICAWLIFKLFNATPEDLKNKPVRIFFAVLLTVIILIPYSYKVINRNAQWKDRSALYRADMQYLENSVKAHDLMGNFLKKRIELELQKPVNVAKFLMPDIQRSVNHFKRAVEIWPGHVSSWVNLGIIYNNPRISEHLLARGDTNEYRRFKRSAISSFKRALELEENEDALFNLGFTYEAIGKMDSAVFFYEQCITSNPQTIYPRSKLANLKFIQGKVDEALELNRQIIYIDPNESLPYLNYGNYYMIMGDTLKSIMNYEEAAVRNARPEVFAFLARYYTSQGNQLKANEYTQKYNNAKASD